MKIQKCVVSVEGWQMQCCGTPFKIGDRVKWTVCKEKLEDGVDYAYEHHGQAAEPFMLTGRVSEIKARYDRGELGPSRNNPDVQITYMRGGTHCSDR